MIERAIAAGVPFAWVAADSVYGVGEIEMALRRAGKGYVLGVSGSHPFNSWGKQAARWPARPRRSPRPCRRRAWSASLGRRRHQGRRGSTTGPIWSWPTSRRSEYDAACARHVDAGPSDPPQPRRRRARLLHDLVPGRAPPIETLVAVEGRRWAIEDAFETAKTELGLDHNETRTWHGWHRHVSLVMLAFAMLAVHPPPGERLPHPQKARAGRRRRQTDPLVGPGDPPHCRAAWPSGASSPPSSSPGPLWRRAHQAAARQRPPQTQDRNCNARLC